MINQWIYRSPIFRQPQPGSPSFRGGRGKDLNSSGFRSKKFKAAPRRILSRVRTALRTLWTSLARHSLTGLFPASLKPHILRTSKWTVHLRTATGFWDPQASLVRTIYCTISPCIHHHFSGLHWLIIIFLLKLLSNPSSEFPIKSSSSLHQIPCNPRINSYEYRENPITSNQTPIIPIIIYILVGYIPHTHIYTYVFF